MFVELIVQKEKRENKGNCILDWGWQENNWQFPTGLMKEERDSVILTAIYL